MSVNVLFTQEKFSLFWRIIFWGFLCVLFYFTLTPVPPEPISLSNMDKVYHFVSFALLGILWLLSYKRAPVYQIFIGCVLIGIAIEVLQLFIPNRGFSVADMVADAAGAGLGMLVAIRVLRAELATD